MNNLLIGHYQTGISGKGRVALPAKFKKILGAKLVVTAGYENSLMLVAAKDWQGLVGEVTNQKLTLGPARATDRFLLGSAFEVELDTQGRFIVPKYLRNLAGLEEEVVFLGVGNRVEIWSQAKWTEYEKYLEKNIAKLGEQLTPLT